MNLDQAWEIAQEIFPGAETVPLAFSNYEGGFGIDLDRTRLHFLLTGGTTFRPGRGLQCFWFVHKDMPGRTSIRVEEDQVMVTSPEGLIGWLSFVRHSWTQRALEWIAGTIQPTNFLPTPFWRREDPLLRAYRFLAVQCRMAPIEIEKGLRPLVSLKWETSKDGAKGLKILTVPAGEHKNCFAYRRDPDSRLWKGRMRVTFPGSPLFRRQRFDIDSAFEGGEALQDVHVREHAERHYVDLAVATLSGLYHAFEAMKPKT